MSRTVQIQAELNIHQAVRAIREFAKGSFGDTNGWLTENEAVDLLAAAEVIHQNVTRKTAQRVVSPTSPLFVCDSCNQPVRVQHYPTNPYPWQWEHVGLNDYRTCPNGWAIRNGTSIVPPELRGLRYINAREVALKKVRLMEEQ